jgi:thiosulfate/3-mercaptopyruvate sulfurtransferase
MRLRSVTPLVFAACLAAPLWAHADALGATQARHALERGAQAWDVRAGRVALVVAGAAKADLRDWERSGSIDDLARAVSAAGIDLSRDVVVYGAAGDPRAQALITALRPVATGQVHWLVGGIDEWQAARLPTQAEATVRWPVPQRLVVRPSAEPAVEPAAGALRRSMPSTAPLLASRG